MKKNLLRIFNATVFATALSAGSLSGQTLISQFDFNGDLSDAFSNSTCTGFNNTITNYVSNSLFWIGDSTNFGGGFEVRVPDALFTETNYSIAIDFLYSEVSGYRKILDFANMNSDQGVYFNGNLRLYSVGSYGPTTINPVTSYTVLLTRNGSDDSTKAYLVNGNTLSLESFGDDANLDYVPVLSGADRVLHFFHDDSTTVSEFSVSGAVSQIRIWNGVATISDIIGVPSYEQQTGISLFPNPANTELNIQFANAQNGTMEIFDAFGKCVRSENLQNENSKRVNVEGLPSGIYFIRVNELNMRFVKQ